MWYYSPAKRPIRLDVEIDKSRLWGRGEPFNGRFISSFPEGERRRKKERERERKGRERKRKREEREREREHMRCDDAIQGELQPAKKREFLSQTRPVFYCLRSDLNLVEAMLGRLMRSCYCLN